MGFGKYLTWWLVVTIVFAIVAYVCVTYYPANTLWPFAVAFLYISVLILMVCKVIVDVCGKPE